MTTPAEQLGKALASGAAPGMQTISAQVLDVTDTGVNLNYLGALVLNVACADSYRNRQAGDWVAVRPGTVPVVLWRLGPDPGEDDTDTVRSIATAAAADLVAISAYTWGAGAPPGSGWQTVTTLYTKKAGDGTGILYAQLASVSDPSPTPPAGRPPASVTISPTATGTWRGGAPDEYTSAPTQGDWTGRGNRRGGWFYGTQIQDACAGKTVASMRAAFTRKTGAGVNAKRPLHLYLHGYTSPPAGQLNLGDGPDDLVSLSVGGRGTATLPAAWRTALAAGTARGLAIYASGSADYLAATGGVLTITFS